MPLQLSIVTPARPLVEAQVDTVVAPGREGQFGVLPGHEPLLASLAPGVVRYQSEGRWHRVAVAGGFAEVSGDRVTLLAPAAERAERIAVDDARAALEQAQQALDHLGSLAPPDEHAAAVDAVDRARARVTAAEEHASA